MRLVMTLPRGLGEDLERTAGITETEFSVLTQLSEAPGRQLRMSELAQCTALSASRISRVIDIMGHRGLVTREPSTDDRRMLFATLTPEGFRACRRAEPEHLLNVRRTLFDQMTDVDVGAVGAVLNRLAQALDPSGPLSDGTSTRKTPRSSTRTRRAPGRVQNAGSTQATDDRMFRETGPQHE
ncbi:MAG: MarR family transcriptional regulator [Acidimicrobiaceae bacterium]|nr:MarR family transcriptional regulator [Acidimicrobiaceae bacterium]